MEDLGLGAGLGAIAFWGFLATCVGFGVWAGIRKREAQHETLRRLVESGQSIDQLPLNKLLGGDKNLSHELKAAGLVALFAMPGFALLGWFLSQLAEWALLPLLGVAALAGCTGVGLLVASKAVELS